MAVKVLRVVGVLQKQRLHMHGGFQGDILFFSVSTVQYVADSSVGRCAWETISHQPGRPCHSVLRRVGSQC
eukprot:56968-Amphidinium_carterae.1